MTYVEKKNTKKPIKQWNRLYAFGNAKMEHDNNTVSAVWFYGGSPENPADAT